MSGKRVLPLSWQIQSSPPNRIKANKKTSLSLSGTKFKVSTHIFQRFVDLGKITMEEELRQFSREFNLLKSQGKLGLDPKEFTAHRVTDIFSDPLVVDSIMNTPFT